MKYLYQWSPAFRSPPRWMAFAYFSPVRGCALFVAFPFNFLVSFAWFIQDRWACLAMAESWIEREIRERQRLYRPKSWQKEYDELTEHLSNRTNEFLQLKQKYQTDVAELNQRLIERTDELMRHFRHNRGGCPTCGSHNTIDGGEACARCGCDLPNVPALAQSGGEKTSTKESNS